MSYAAFKTIFRIKAAFGIVLRVIGGFLNAAKSSSRRVMEGILDLESHFHEGRSKLYINVLLSLKKQPKNLETVSGYSESTDKIHLMTLSV
jgi:hypothetical protein